MHISDLLRQYNKAGSQSEPITKNKGVERFSSPLSSMSKGNIFEGTVNSVKGNQVILGLSNGQQITARMDGKLSFVQGQSMFFQVKSNDGAQIAIRPFTVDGSGANYTLLEALKAAGLPTEQEYIQMVNKMMEEQMSIDRASLQSMARVMQNSQGIDVTTLVQLQKLNLPITPEIASQYENYLGDRQSITWALDQFINELPEILSDENLPTEKMTSMGKEILDIVTEGLSEKVSSEMHIEYTIGSAEEMISGNDILSGKTGVNVSNLQGMESELTSKSENIENVNNASEATAADVNVDKTGVIEAGATENIETVNELAETTGSEAVTIENEAVENQVSENKASEDSNIKNLDIKNNIDGTGENESVTGKVLNNVQASNNSDTTVTVSNSTVIMNSLGSILSDEEIQYLNGQLRVLFSEDSSGIFSEESIVDTNEAVEEQAEITSEQNAQETQKGDGAVEKQTVENQSETITHRFSPVTRETSVVSVLNNIKKFLEANPNADKKALTALFSGKEFKQMIKDSLDQQWTIKPKDIEGSDKINRLYEHLENQIDRMENIVKAAGQPNENIANLAANIRDNVEFMNQINQAYTYVQIPLKMSGQSASGQLYVYTNKKNLEQGDRELSAFLHLDMDNLGGTDISVKMYKKDVTTNFYMETDEAYDLVRQFMPQLEARLKAKGYNCKIIVSNESNKVNFVEDFLKKDQPSAGKVHRYSFDMRA